MTTTTSTSTSQQLLVTVGLLADSLVIGATIWIFFLQSPALFAFMGRSKFIPPMMRLTKVLFRWTLPVASAVALSTSLMLTATDACTTATYATSSTSWAILSAIAVALNSLVVVPRALAAGAKAITGQGGQSTSTSTANSSTWSKTTKIAVSGGDGNTKSVTRMLHQTVVVLVVLMLVGAVGHLHFSVHSECR
jgi:hypothetical protein